MQLKALFAVILTVLPVVISHGGGSSKDCNGNQFWADKQGCCLDKGGPKNPPPPPPKGNECKNNDYWHPGQKCCVPRCPNGWTYNPSTHECKCPTPPTPPQNPPQPSGHPGGGHGGGHGGPPGGGHGGGHGGWGKRSTKSRSEVCPLDTFACPIADVPGDFECLDTSRDLVSCGGCASEGKGQDCSKIEFVDNVACENKSCKVYTCESGYKPSLDGTSCLAL